jgi:Ca2+-binding RTX toxin-like protein
LDTVSIKGTMTYVVTAGQALEFKSVSGFVLNSDGFTAPFLTIAGSVKVYDEIGSPYSNVPIYGIAFSEGFFKDSAVRIEAGGSLTVEHLNGLGHAYGFFASSRSGDFFNAGRLTVTATQVAVGLRTYDDGALGGDFVFENTGTITANAPYLAQGVAIINGGAFTNRGVIEVTGGGLANSDTVAVQLTGFDSSFLNTGTIRAITGGVGDPGIALEWNSTMSAGQTFVNAGILQGDYALMQWAYVDIVSNANWEFVNTGSMIGKVRMGQTGERLINSGLITGPVELGFGDDVFDGRNGVQQGMINGERGRDSILGGAGAETLAGGVDADTVSGGAGDDILVGGEGQDHLSGGQGADLFLVETTHGAVTAAEVDRIADWSSDDKLKFGSLTGLTAGGALARSSAGDMGSAITQATDLIAKGAAYVAVQVGGDLVVFSATEAVALLGRSHQDFADAQILRATPPPLPTVGTSGADDLSLSTGADTFDGMAGNDHVFGLDGRDQVSGGDGDDVVSGGDGDDRVDGGLGDDQVYGDIGNDTLSDPGGSNYIRGAEGDDSIVGGTGFDDINGNTGNDTASGGLGEDWVVGGKDNDSLSGGDAYDLVYGNLGNDTISGDGGNDIVRGGQQDDVLFGGAGDDYMSGDKDSDTVSGGAGADVFHTFGDAGMDRVLDFSLAEGDRVQVDPGTQYAVAQVGADTVISMTGGAQMVLVGVQMSSLTGSWIFGA